MSQEGRTDAADLRERVSLFLMRNFPQIAMHGGDAAIEAIDEETGEVWIQLGGACSGCGISPMTVQAITQRMPMEIPEINTVHADAGGFGAGANTIGGRQGRDDGQDFPDVPF